MKRIALTLLIVLVPAFGAGAGTTDDGSAAMARAAAYLWSKQGADGGWHSETYGLLRSGQSLTPFVLLALLDLPDPPKEAVDRAIAFIRKHTDAEGAVGRSDPSLEDYPTFATSLAVRALLKAGKSDGINRMIEGLRRQQFAEGGGWRPDHPVYGAWGMGGPPRKPPHTGHVDLSMTRHALQALVQAGAAGEAGVRVRKYLERCQNPDGGFLFSTVVLDANKAGVGRSYGTATADGLLALLAAGGKPDEGRSASALAWLVKRHRVDGVPGFDDADAKWREGMIYYYLAASARAFREARGGPEGWRKTMVASLVERQRVDGSFKNASFLMKEDDPLIATAFALMALLAAS